MTDIMEKISRSEIRNIVRNRCTTRRSVFLNELSEIKNTARNEVETAIKPILEEFYRQCKEKGLKVECYRGCFETIKIIEGHDNKGRMDELNNRCESVNTLQNETLEKVELAEDAAELKSIVTVLTQKLTEV